jgi:hypothetical protein
LHLIDAKPSTCRANHDAYYALACCAQAYQPHPLSHRIIKLLYQSEAGLLIAVGCAQVRNMPSHQCRCDTSTARILSDAQSLFGRYEYERPNVLEGHRLSELSEWIKGSERTSQNVFFVG